MERNKASGRYTSIKKEDCLFLIRDNCTWLSTSKLPPYVHELLANCLGHQVISVGKEGYKIS